MQIGIKVNGKAVYVTPTGVKVGSKGKVGTVAATTPSLTKGERRALRKQLRAAGFANQAAS